MKKNENKKESKKKIIYVFIIIGVICLRVFIKCVLPSIIERAKVNKICSEYFYGDYYVKKNPWPEECNKPGVHCTVYPWSCCSSTAVDDDSLCVDIRPDDY